jgi:hypothetical protein
MNFLKQENKNKPNFNSLKQSVLNCNLKMQFSDQTSWEFI